MSRKQKYINCDSSICLSQFSHDWNVRVYIRFFIENICCWITNLQRAIGWQTKYIFNKAGWWTFWKSHRLVLSVFMFLQRVVFKISGHWRLLSKCENLRTPLVIVNCCLITWPCEQSLPISALSYDFVIRDFRTCFR